MSLRLNALPIQADERGVAAVEFALILPLLVLLFFGALETSNLLIADSRLRNSVGAIADLITQKSNGSVSLSDMQVANIAGRAIMDPLPLMSGSTPKLAFLLAMHRPASTTASTVVWSRVIDSASTTPSTGPSQGLNALDCTDSSLPVALLPTDVSQPFNDVLQVTGVYEWRPWFTILFGTSIHLRSTNYNMPRYSLQLGPAADVSPPC